jgi:hypothetical protein
LQDDRADRDLGEGDGQVAPTQSGWHGLPAVPGTVTVRQPTLSTVKEPLAEALVTVVKSAGRVI